MAYLQDRFTEPAGYRVDVAIDIGDVFEAVIDMLVCHESQWFEWLPYDSGILDEVPEGAAARREWFAARMRTRFGGIADQGREKLIKTYGEERGQAVKCAEVLMISEYGGRPEPEDIPRLFPFLPQQ